MKFIPTLLILAFFTLFGCSRNEPAVFALTQSELLAKYSSASVTVVKYGGPSLGPYRDSGSFVGHHDGTISCTFKNKGNEVHVSAPAEIGFYYQVSSFTTPTGEIFWVLLKLKNKKAEPNQGE